MSQIPASNTTPKNCENGTVKRRFRRRYKALIGSLVLLAIIGVLAYFYRDWLTDQCMMIWELLKDKEAFRQKIESYGVWAPFVFVVFQIFQVLISPIPGELVGAAGGYVFGWFPSLVYSTIGLSLGSWINFFAARLLGQKFVESLIPPKYMKKLARVMERQGIIASFMFFVFPGFPKDYFCYVLGLTPMNWKVFMVVSSVGRVPGTLVLGLQGYFVYNGDYSSFIWLGILSLALIAPVYFFRERIYQIMGKLEGKPVESGECEEEKNKAVPE